MSRTLVVRAGALGDVLLLRPALAALRAAGHEVFLLSPSPGRVYLEDHEALVAGWLDFEDPALGRGLTDASAPWPLTWPSFDAAVVVSKDARVLALVGRHVGRVLCCEPQPPPGVHASDDLLTCLRSWKIPPAPSLPAWRPGPSAIGDAARLLSELPDRFVAIHPGSGSASKNWPAARFAALATALSGGGPWLLLEGPADRLAVEAMKAPRGAVVSGPIGVPALAALLARAGLFVGNDSGVTHLAACVGAPTVAIFGPTDATRWRPLGTNVRVIEAPGGDLDRLDVDAVLAIAAALEDAAANRSA